MNRILVVDCLNQMFALHHCNTPNKAITFLKDLRNVVIETKTNKIILGCDFGKSAFRLKLHPAYKSDRYKRREEQSEADKKKLEAFFQEVTEFQDKVAPLFGLEVLKFYGVEQDDLASYIVNHTDLNENQVLLLSSDKDLQQLLRKNVVQRSAYFKMKVGKENLPAKVWLNRKRFVDAYEIEPPQLAHVKALGGDAGDSIYSPKGLGGETALKLVRQYGSIDGVEKNLHNIRSDIARVSQKVVDELASNFEQVRKNYDLVNLNYTDEIKNEIFSFDLQERLKYTIDNFDVKPKVDRESIEEFLLQRGEVNLLMKLDSWIQPFEGKFE